MISVIIPVYNVESFLAECIDSIILQTYSNIEIILVDDGSTDNSGYICDEYAQKDDRIKTLHKKNGGLSSARNFGIDNCNGDYVMFLDSDDFVKKDYCETFIKSLQDNMHIGIVSSGLLSYIDYRSLDNTPAKKGGGDYVYKEFIMRALRGKSSNSVCGKLFNRDIISKTRFREGRNNEDSLFLFDLFEANNGDFKVREIPYSGYYYRYRESSICHNPDNPLYLQILNNDQLMTSNTSDFELRRLTRDLYWFHSFLFCEELLREDYWKDNSMQMPYFDKYYSIIKKTSIKVIWNASLSYKSVVKFFLMTRIFKLYKYIFVK